MTFQLFCFVSLSFFSLGICGILLNRRNLLLLLLSVELFLLGIELLFIGGSLYLDDIMGQLFVLFLLTVAAGEAAIGLAILVIYYRLRQSLRMDEGYLLRH